MPRIRCSEVRARQTREVLKTAGIPRVDELTEAELCRIHRKMQRNPYLNSLVRDRGPGYVPPNLLHTLSARRARARITHPGKRFR